MDTELLRTFIEIVRTRHFGRAASNLYLTQSAVSARMRLLEETLGVRLLTRERNDIQLTAEGRILLDHAEDIVDRWKQARAAVAVRVEGKVSVKVGLSLAAADVYIDAWLSTITETSKDVSLSLRILDEAAIMRGCEDGSFDLGLLFEESNDPRLRSREMRSLRLSLASSSAASVFSEHLGTEYVYVDWGAWFNTAHAMHFPEYVPGALRLPSPRLAARLVEDYGGSAYLPDALQGGLSAVRGAPVIERVMFAVYRAESDRRDVVETLADLLEEPGVGE